MTTKAKSIEEHPCCRELIARVESLMAEIEAIKRMLVAMGHELRTHGVRVKFW